MATAYQKLGEPAKAAAIWKEFAYHVESRFGFFHSFTSEVYQNYGDALTEGGNWIELELLWTGVVDKRKEVVGKDFEHIIWPLIQLCKAFSHQKKFRELRKREEECLELIKQSYGEKSEIAT